MTETAKFSRHALRLTSNLQRPEKLYSYILRATYKDQCERMRLFIREATASRDRLESLVELFRQLTTVDAFCALLKAEGLAAMPRILAARILGNRPNVRLVGKNPNPDTNRQLVAGICPDALEMLVDGPVPREIFGLLRKVAPSRQIEIARLMIGLDKVKLKWARVLVALTPQAQLASPSVTRTQFAGIDANDVAAMEAELADLSQEFLSTAEHLGSWGLELVAVRGYLNRMMDSARVVRYLAQNFPELLSEFQKFTEPTHS